MTTFLFVRGMDNVTLAEDETFNKARQRINEAVTGTGRDGEKAENQVRNRPLHKLSFKTADGGRIAVAPEHVIGVGSDEPKDVTGGEE